MAYRVVYHKRVLKFLQKCDKKSAKTIVAFFDRIKEDLDFSDYDVKPLKGTENSYRLRIGKYRVIFSVHRSELLIKAVDAGSRGDIYK